VLLSRGVVLAPPIVLFNTGTYLKYAPRSSPGF